MRGIHVRSLVPGDPTCVESVSMSVMTELPSLASRAHVPGGLCSAREAPARSIRRPQLQSGPRPPHRDAACLQQPRPRPAENNLFIKECTPRAVTGRGQGGGCLGEQASEGVARRRERERVAWGHSRAVSGTGTGRELALLAGPHPRPHFLFFGPLSWSQHAA